MGIIMKQPNLQTLFALFVLLAGIFIYTGCTRTQPHLSHEQKDSLVSVMANLSIGFEVAERDSTRYFPLRDSILNSYGADTLWLQSKTETIGDDAETWLEIWDSVRSRLEVLKDSLTP